MNAAQYAVVEHFAVALPAPLRLADALRLRCPVNGGRNPRKTGSACLFWEQEMLCGCNAVQPRSRVNGRLRPYAAWRSEPLTRCRGDTLGHGSKRGTLALTAMQTSAFHPK